MRRSWWAFLLVGVLAGHWVAAPVKAEETEPASALEQARRLATQGRRSEALRLLEDSLTRTPEDSDLRVLYGLVLSWEGRYEEARKQLVEVLDQHPSYGDAVQALINVELWSGHPERAEQLAAQGLQRRPGDVQLLFQRARALEALHRPAEARQVVEHLLAVDPEHKQAKQMRRGLEEQALGWQLGLDQFYERFSDGREPWRELQFELRRRSGPVPLTLRAARADRFSVHSNQAELDFYPHFAKRTYAYLNAGYSPDATLYPVYRFGAELYQGLGGGWEGSAGFRRLGFTQKVNIFTASMAKYYGNWLFTGRAYLTPDSLGASHSVHISARRFFRGGTEDYVSVRYGRGNSQEEARKINDVLVVDADALYGELQVSLSHHVQLKLRGGYSREERLERNELRHYWGSTGLWFRF